MWLRTLFRNESSSSGRRTTRPVRHFERFLNNINAIIANFWFILSHIPFPLCFFCFCKSWYHANCSDICTRKKREEMEDAKQPQAAFSKPRQMQFSCSRNFFALRVWCGSRSLGVCCSF
eukprot:GHVT01034975.1.p1 GENE.GHVT01034975.1~~GHVT01034975.1.p1  ORF type:complete len:119 (-),score=2.54 GHVT01034975.1:52-408(-)